MFYRVNFSIPQDVFGKEGTTDQGTFCFDGRWVNQSKKSESTNTIHSVDSDNCTLLLSPEPGWNIIDTGRVYESYMDALTVLKRLIEYHPFVQSAAIMHNHPKCEGILCWEEKHTDPEVFKQHKETNKKYGHPELEGWADGWQIESCGCVGAGYGHESDCKGGTWPTGKREEYTIDE